MSDDIIINPSKKEKWWENFDEVKQFYQENGHLTLPKRRLRTWISYQRKHAKSLADEQLHALESIDYMSIQRKRDEAEWKSNFNRLVSDPNARSKKMKQWIYRQRRLHSLGKLSKEKAQLLETHGYRMTSTNPLCGKGMKSGKKRDERWNEKFKRLQEYRNTNGNVDIPFRYPADQSLANWVVAQRCRSKETDKDGNPLMDKEKVDKLNSIGFIWSKY